MASYFENLRIFTAEKFRDSVGQSSAAANLYVSFGKNTQWSLDDDIPLATVANNKTDARIWKDMIGAKKIASTDIRHVIKRYDWEANTVYTQYDDQDTTLFNDNVKFYVLTTDYNVYKCIDNRNGRKSNVMPTSVATNTTVTLSDGYIWKYMYTLTNEERLKFLIDDYMPIKTLKLNDSTLQWQVQENATEGAIHSIVVTNGGSGYTNASNIVITVTGDGNGATAIATTNQNTINAIVMSTIGTNYTEATVRISGGGGSSATARAIISPFGGHGSNPVYELGGKNILINGRLVGNENNKYPSTSEFRQMALIKDPKIYGTNRISSNTVISQTMDLILYNFAVSAGVSIDYDVAETVYQGNSVDDYTFKANVVDWDGANNVIRLNNITGTPTLYQSLYGEVTLTEKLINSIKTPDLKPDSGQTLYVDNFLPITKDPHQTEDLKVLIKF